MKKFLPAVLILILVLTGIAAAEAPYSLSVKLDEGNASYTSRIIVVNGDKLVLNMGETVVIFSIDGKTEEGLIFTPDTLMDKVEDELSSQVNSSFVLPEKTEITLAIRDTETPLVTLSWEQLEMDPLYQEVIDKVSAVLGGAESDQDGKEVRDYSIMFDMAAKMGNAANMGFLFRDLDNDGNVELLFGENYADETVLYDLYAIVDGKLVHVFDGWDRSRYYLAENGGFIHKGSSSAFDASVGYYYYINGEFHFMQAIIYNENLDPNVPWHLSTTSETEFSDDDQLLTEEEALYVMAMYPAQKLNLEPFEF